MFIRGGDYFWGRGGAYLRMVLICGCFFEEDFIQKEPCLKRPFFRWELIQRSLICEGPFFQEKPNLRGPYLTFSNEASFQGCLIQGSP